MQYRNMFYGFVFCFMKVIYFPSPSLGDENSAKDTQKFDAGVVLVVLTGKAKGRCYVPSKSLHNKIAGSVQERMLQTRMHKGEYGSRA